MKRILKRCNPQFLLQAIRNDHWKLSFHPNIASFRKKNWYFLNFTASWKCIWKGDMRFSSQPICVFPLKQYFGHKNQLVLARKADIILHFLHYKASFHHKVGFRKVESTIFRNFHQKPHLSLENPTSVSRNKLYSLVLFPFQSIFSSLKLVLKRWNEQFWLHAPRNCHKIHFVFMTSNHLQQKTSDFLLLLFFISQQFFTACQQIPQRKREMRSQGLHGNKKQ